MLFVAPMAVNLVQRQEVRNIRQNLAVVVDLALRESTPRQIDKSRVPRRRKGSGALEVEIGVWNSQEGGKDKLFFSTFISLCQLHNSV